MAGPKEWGPKPEPSESEMEFSGLRFHIRRLGTPGWSPKEESYHVTVVSPEGAEYPVRVSVKSSHRYRGMGMLYAALDALTDLENVKEDFGLYLQILRENVPARFGADAMAVAARKASRAFPLGTVQEAKDLIAAELRKNPVIQRELKRGWEELMRRRGQQP